MPKAKAYIDDPQKGKLSVPRAVLMKVKEGLQLQAEIKQAGETLKILKKELLEDLGNDVIVVVPEEGKLIISPTNTLKVDDEDEFIDLFGDRALDLLTEKTTYSVSSKLKEVANDPDHEDHEEVMSCCSLYIGTQTSFKPDVKAK